MDARSFTISRLWTIPAWRENQIKKRRQFWDSELGMRRREEQSERTKQLWAEQDFRYRIVKTLRGRRTSESWFWTDARTKRLQTLKTRGCTYAMMAEDIGCSRGAIAGKIRRLREASHV